MKLWRPKRSSQIPSCRTRLHRSAHCTGLGQIPFICPSSNGVLCRALKVVPCMTKADAQPFCEVREEVNRAELRVHKQIKGSQLLEGAHACPLPNRQHQQSVSGAECGKNQNELLAPGSFGWILRKIKVTYAFLYPNCILSGCCLWVV